MQTAPSRLNPESFPSSITFLGPKVPLSGSSASLTPKETSRASLSLPLHEHHHAGSSSGGAPMETQADKALTAAESVLTQLEVNSNITMVNAAQAGTTKPPRSPQRSPRNQLSSSSRTHTPRARPSTGGGRSASGGRLHGSASARSRSPNLTLQPRSLSYPRPSATPPPVTSALPAATAGSFLLSSASTPAAFYGSALPSPQPAFPPGKVLKSTSRAGRRTHGTTVTYQVQYGQLHPAAASAAELVVTAQRANPAQRAVARAARAREARPAQTTAAATIRATAISEADPTAATKPLAPLTGLTAKAQLLRESPALPSSAYEQKMSCDLSRRIPVSQALDPRDSAAAAVAAAKVDGVLLTNSATETGGGPCDKDTKDTEAVRKLYERELQLRLFEATRQAEARLAAEENLRAGGDHDSVAVAAASFLQQHQRQRELNPVDYQLCFQAVLDPEGAEVERMAAAAEVEEEDDGSGMGLGGAGNITYVENRALRVVDRSRFSAGLSSQAAALLQDPLTLLACEHLLEDTGKNAISAAPTLTTKLTSGGANQDAAATAKSGDAIQSWIAEANNVFARQAEAQTALGGGEGGPTPTSVPRSVLKAVPPPGEVFVELSYAAKVLLAAVLYVRALGGFPTLLRVGPLTDMSPVVDKENCIELVFWNPKLDSAALAEQARRQQREVAEVQVRPAESDGHVNDVQNRLVRTLSAVMATPSVSVGATATEGAVAASVPASRDGSFLISGTTTSAATGGGLFGPQLISRQNSILGRHDSFLSASAGGAAAASTANQIAGRATHTATSGSQTHRQTSGAAAAANASMQRKRLSVTFDGDAALMGCEHEVLPPVDFMERNSPSAGAAAAELHENSSSSGIPRVAVTDATTRRRLRRSSTLPATGAGDAAEKAPKSGASGQNEAASAMERAARLVGGSRTSLPGSVGTDGSEADGSPNRKQQQQPPKPPATPTKGGDPLITEVEDELCVVLRAVIAQKSKVFRFGEEDTIHVLPPLPREEEDVQRQLLRDVTLDRLAVKNSDPLYRFLQDDEAKRDAKAKRQAALMERQRRLNARGPVTVNEDGTPSAEDYGDLVVAMLLSGEASQLSGALPDAMELEALRYRIFSLQGYSTKDPYGVNARKKEGSLGNLAADVGATSTPPPQQQQQQAAEPPMGRRDSILGSTGSGMTAEQVQGLRRLESILVSPSQSFKLRQPPSMASPLAATAGRSSLRRESSFQTELSRTFGFTSGHQLADGDTGDASPANLTEAARASTRAAAAAAEANKRRLQIAKERARRQALAFPLYRASSVSERTLSAYHAEERAAAAARRLAWGAEVAGGQPPPPPPRRASDSDGEDGGRLNLQSADERELLRFRPFNYNGFYEELRGAVQYALDVQVRQTKEKVMQAFHM